MSQAERVFRTGRNEAELVRGNTEDPLRAEGKKQSGRCCSYDLVYGHRGKAADTVQRACEVFSSCKVEVASSPQYF